MGVTRIQLIHGITHHFKCSLALFLTPGAGDSVGKITSTWRSQLLAETSLARPSFADLSPRAAVLAHVHSPHHQLDGRLHPGPPGHPAHHAPHKKNGQQSVYDRCSTLFNRFFTRLRCWWGWAEADSHMTALPLI